MASPVKPHKTYSYRGLGAWDEAKNSGFTRFHLAHVQTRTRETYFALLQAHASAGARGAGMVAHGHRGTRHGRARPKRARAGAVAGLEKPVKSKEEEGIGEKRKKKDGYYSHFVPLFY